MRFAARGLGVTEYDNLLAKSVVHRDRISSLIGISKTVQCHVHGMNHLVRFRESV